MSPAVSVLMTIYNPGRYLVPAVESVLAQSFRDFELVAVENGSTDGSREVLRALAARDSRIKVVELAANIGRTPALLRAFDLAVGPLVAVQDADDLSMPLRLERQVDYMRRHPECALLGTWCRLIDADDRAIGVFHPPTTPDDAYQALCHTNVVAHSAAIYRRQAAMAAGGYPADLAYAQDYGLWVRMVRHGGIANLAEELTAIRQHAGALSLAPETVFVRSMDAIRMFREAAGLPNLTPRARRLNRRVEAMESGRLAKAMARRQRWAQAAGWILRGFLRDPLSMTCRALKRHPTL